MIDAIETEFGRAADRAAVQICVPGAGLSRLAWELAALGYSTTANEQSLFMLFVAHYILNQCDAPHTCTVYPYVHQFSNVIRAGDQLRAVTFPDVDTNSLAKRAANNRFAMEAGEFVEIYADTARADSFDAVATVFMLDTARNIIDYIDTIYAMLRPNGIWINHGPLLYHFADMSNERSIELPLEHVQAIVRKSGFVIEREELRPPCHYTNNDRSMLQYSYVCCFMICRKLADPPSD